MVTSLDDLLHEVERATRPALLLLNCRDLWCGVAAHESDSGNFAEHGRWLRHCHRRRQFGRPSR